MLHNGGMKYDVSNTPVDEFKMITSVRRLVAYAIDIAYILGFSYVVIGIIAMVMSGISWVEFNSGAGAENGSLILVPLGWYAFHTWFVHTKRRSLGMLLTGSRLVPINASKITCQRSISWVFFQSSKYLLSKFSDESVENKTNLRMVESSEQAVSTGLEDSVCTEPWRNN